MLFHHFNVNFSIHNNCLLINLHEFPLFLIVLIVNLADNFLNNIFKGDQAPNPAKLISNHSHMIFFGLKFSEQFSDRF